MARWPRIWSLHTLLAAVAISAATLGWVRFEMTRPYPTVVVTNGATPAGIIWSDHKMHDRDRGQGIYPVVARNGRIISRVNWSDGAATRHLHRPRAAAYSDWP